MADAEVIRLTGIISERQRGSQRARAIEAAGFLRRAIEIVAGLDSDPEVVRAAQLMCHAADALGSWNPQRTA